jgi:AAA ATPase domain
MAPQDSYEPPLASTVADRLKSARRRRFVGRAAEVELFLGALALPEPPFSVLWIHGPGGVGKTTLLGALADAATDAGVGPVSLDLRAIEPSLPAFLAELGRAAGLPAEASPQEALAGRVPAVLLLDTFEAAVGLEDWLREEFVPALPVRALVVVAARNGTSGWGRSRRASCRASSRARAGPGSKRTTAGIGRRRYTTSAPEPAGRVPRAAHGRRCCSPSWPCWP